MRIKIEKIVEIVRDFLHVLALLALGILAFNAIIPIKLNSKSTIETICASIGINEIYTFVGAIAFLLIGAVGIYEYAYLNGISWLAPSSYIKFKDKNNIKQAERMMELYYKRDIEFIQEYENERTEVILQAIGIREKQFKYINYEIIKARVMPDRSIYALSRKAMKTLFHKEFIVNQSKLESSKRVYDKVDYFINLYTALYDEIMCKTVASIMSRFLVLSLREKVEEIDYIIIPKGSNFLLGLEVGKLLDKKVISVLEEERIYKNVFWDGIYDTSKKNNIIVIHDVLVTGKRIYESIEKLPKDTYCLEGIYCLFKYNHSEFTPIKDFEAHGINGKNIKWLLDIDESLLKEIFEGTYEMEY